jgi:type IV pilus assembly protein PilQ
MQQNKNINKSIITVLIIFTLSAFILYFYEISPHIELINNLKAELINSKRQLVLSRKNNNSNNSNNSDIKKNIVLLKPPAIKETHHLLTIDFKQMNIREAIYQLAKYLKINVILSPQIQGETTFYLHEVASFHAFEVLLKSHGLAKWQLGNIWFITTSEELIKQQQEEIKWHTLQEESLNLVTETWQLNFAQAKDILFILKDNQNSFLSKRGYVNMDGRTNRLIIIDTKDHIAAIHRLLEKLDVPIKQILIHVRLINIDESLERELGLDFTLSGQLSLAKLTTVKNQILLDMKLAAMQHQGKAELISNPILFTGNQQLASIESGEEIPYQEISESGGTAVSFKKAVLALKVKPQILPNNKILLQLQINQDRPNSRMVQGVPSITTEQIISNVLVNNGQTIVLGGIYETNLAQNQKQLPFMNEIPILGSFMKQTNTQHNKRKLLILVTPSVVTYENESK